MDVSSNISSRNPIQNNVERFNNHIPVRLINDIAYCCDFMYNKSSHFVLVITSNYYIYEVQEKQILNSIMLIEKQKLLSTDDYIEIKIYYCYSQIFQKQIFFLIKINNDLYVVKRKQIGLSIHSNYKNIKNFKVIPHNEYERILIEFNDETLPLITDFSDVHIADDSKPVVMMAHFQDAMRMLKTKTNEARAEYNSHQLLSQEHFNKHIRESRFGGTELITECPEERSPLVKYGDIWIKVNNEKVVIGIPVMNCTYSRRFTLQNIRPILYCTEQENISFEFNLYKLQNDSYNFENVYELFENYKNKNEDDFQDIPVYDQEWTTYKKNILHPETSGIIIITMDLMNINNYINYNYKCFILYDILTTNNKFKTLQLYVGDILLETEIFLNKKYLINYNKINEIYRDLLTIVSTSKFVHLKLSYQREPNEKFEMFLLNKMRFIRIQRSTSTDETESNERKMTECLVGESMQIDEELTLLDLNITKSSSNQMDLFYHDEEEYWKGSLIRLNYLDDSNVLLKIYTKHEHQILTFVQCIYSEYVGKCTIIPIKYSSDSFESRKQEYKNSLIDEINLNIEFCKQKQLEESKNNLVPTTTEYMKKRFCKELRTDIAYKFSSF